MAIEEPKFTLVEKSGDFELRDYAPNVVAEVTIIGDQQTASSTGFRLLAGYIFGGNSRAQKIAMTAPVSKIATGEKIAMTAPVTQIGGEADHWLVRFTLPSALALADLPVPYDPQVRLHAQPAARFAVLRFSGLTGVKRVATQTARLMALLSSRSLHAAGPMALARYNPPWTLWFLRRNEVILSVESA